MARKAPVDFNAPFQSARPETHEEWQARMGGEVLAVLRSGLYLEFRFLDQALGALHPVPRRAVRGAGHRRQQPLLPAQRPAAALPAEPQVPEPVISAHDIPLCIPPPLDAGQPGPGAVAHRLATFAVENVIDGLGRKSVARPLTYVRRRAYEALTAGGHVAAAAPAYRWLLTQTPGVQKQLAREFYADDHRLWPRPGQPDPPQQPTPQGPGGLAEDRPPEDGDGAGTARQRGRRRGRESGRGRSRPPTAAAAATGIFCAGSASCGRSPASTPDTFDLNFYTYGLSVYGNMPLIEPVETRESKKIEEIALVIDTSYSTSGALVRSFLSETYALLKQRESFFRRMNPAHHPGRQPDPAGPPCHHRGTN